MSSECCAPVGQADRRLQHGGSTRRRAPRSAKAALDSGRSHRHRPCYHNGPWGRPRRRGRSSATTGPAWARRARGPRAPSTPTRRASDGGAAVGSTAPRASRERRRRRTPRSRSLGRRKARWPAGRLFVRWRASKTTDARRGCAWAARSAAPQRVGPREKKGDQAAPTVLVAHWALLPPPTLHARYAGSSPTHTCALMPASVGSLAAVANVLSCLCRDTRPCRVGGGDARPTLPPLNLIGLVGERCGVHARQ